MEETSSPSSGAKADEGLQGGNSIQSEPLTEENRAAVGAYLVHRAREAIETLNRRDWKHFMDGAGIAPTFIAHVDEVSCPLKWEELVDCQHKWVEKTPNYHIDVVSSSVNVNDTGDHASVYVICEIIGRPSEIRGEKMIVFEYTKKRGLWLKTRQTSLRASFSIGVTDFSRC